MAIPLLVSASGAPPAIRTGGADAGDHRQVLPVVLDYPGVGGTPGRPKGPPDDLYADRGYDGEGARASPRRPGIGPHIAERKAPHGSGLGKVRRAVERAIGRSEGLRRLRVRYDRLGAIMDARTTIAASATCFRMLPHDVM